MGKGNEDYTLCRYFNASNKLRHLAFLKDRCAEILVEESKMFLR
jgi:hypothetical protein